MTQLVRTQRCFQHPDREAVARCPSCERYFCRECVSDYNGRLLCADCLSLETGEAAREGTAWLSPLTGWVLALLSLAALWLWFYGLGRLLARIPDQVPDWFLDL